MSSIIAPCHSYTIYTILREVLIVVAQALLVQSALTAMSRQRMRANPEAQHAPASETQLSSSSTETAPFRAECNASLAATAARAQEVGNPTGRFTACVAVTQP